MKAAAIIAAAGLGRRMQQDTPKTYLQLAGKPILIHTLEVFEKVPEVHEVLVVVHPEDLGFCQEEVIDPYPLKKVLRLVPGGKERQDSVYHALKVLKKEAADLDVILVHDGVRPLVDPALVRKVVGLPGGHGTGFLCHRRGGPGGSPGRDSGGGAGHLPEPEDHHSGRFENSRGHPGLSPNTVMRVGFGYDAHRLVPGRPLILGGVEIPHHSGLGGHSDADVLTHALGDALLGAVAAGDLGRHFPDSDPAYRGISSLILLERIVTVVQSRGFQPLNVDVTVVAEQPRLAPYVPQMIDKLAPILGLAPDAVSIKATSTEKMGFAGREEGIAAYAVVLVARELEPLPFTPELG
jgi:2-C-methyl-D-erythritol 2,4-cyclodiphosphate synthase